MQKAKKERKRNLEKKETERKKERLRKGGRYLKYHGPLLHARAAAGYSMHAGTCCPHACRTQVARRHRNTLFLDGLALSAAAMSAACYTVCHTCRYTTAAPAAVTGDAPADIYRARAYCAAFCAGDGRGSVSNNGAGVPYGRAYYL